MKNDLRLTKSLHVMGTDISIDLVIDKREQKRGEKSMRDSFSFFEKMQKKFSRFDQTSELQMVNASRGAYIQVSKEFLEVLDHAITYHYRSGGIFDPRIHDALVCAGYDRDFHTHDLSKKTHVIKEASCIDLEITHNLLRDDVVIDHENSMVMIDHAIDLTGIVKGWAVDRVKKFISNEGVRGYIIDAGGDMWVQGVDEKGQGWYIGIEGIDDEKILLCIDGEGVATSGVTRRQWTHDGEKKHHLIDPQNNRTFSFDISTVTVISHNVMDADVWAKVLFLKGVKDGLAYAHAHRIKAIFIDHKHNIFISRYAQENIV